MEGEEDESLLLSLMLLVSDSNLRTAKEEQERLSPSSWNHCGKVLHLRPAEAHVSDLRSKSYRCPCRRTCFTVALAYHHNVTIMNEEVVVVCF
ncbi:hypothetical protein JHK82_032622 [Glycine max]|nr:hypothetical protein JHK82_032622 [Glycine max]